ncbi:MAG: DUF5686 family protein, partial [Saprospiraceae bacterium]
IDKETAALRSLEVYVLDQINVNYLTGLEVKQEYQYLGDGNWFKKGERMMVLMNLTENKEKQAVRVVRTASFDDVKINEPYEDEVFKGDIEEIIAEAYKREEDYWTKERHTELSTTEENIYKSVKKVKETRAFKIYNYLGRTVSSGFLNAGPIEFGRFFQFYSFNAIEGNRYRMGFRTNPRQFRDKFLIEGYGAYGDKDKLFKYHLGAKFHLKRTNNKWHMIGGHYHYDWSDYNFRNPYMTHDHILGSLLRKKNQPLDNLFLMREGYVFYEKEWIKGFTNTFSAKHKSIYEWDGYFEIDDAINEDDNIQALEFTVNTQWGLGQLMVGRQGGFGREAIDISAPVLNVEYTIGVKNWLGSDYGYHRLNTRLSQK